MKVTRSPSTPAPSGPVSPGKTNSGGTFHTVSGVGVYHVTVVDTIGCIATDTMEITAEVPYPTPNFGPDTILCVNSTLDLDAGPGDSYVLVQWRHWSNPDHQCQSWPLPGNGHRSSGLQHHRGSHYPGTIFPCPRPTSAMRSGSVPETQPSLMSPTATRPTICGIPGRPPLLSPLSPTGNTRSR